MNEHEEILMTRYLFGELSEAEQGQLEERYFADRQIFDQLAQLETRLLDEYARGSLPAQMHARFERAYLDNPHRRARVKFSDALTARIDQAAASPEQTSVPATSLRHRILSLLTGRPRALRLAMAAALLFSFVAVWLFIQNQRLLHDLARTRDARDAQTRQEGKTEEQLTMERDRNQQLTAELERVRAEAQPHLMSPARSVATLALIIGDARGTVIGTPPTLIIRKETKQVRLQLKRSDNEYKSYELTLQAAGGKEIFNRRHVRPMVTKSGASFVFTLPASQISAGDYILTLRGHLLNGELEDVSQSLFRVEKQ